MKHLLVIGLLSASTLGCLVFGQNKGPEVHTFTRSSDGKEMEAVVLSYDGEKVTIVNRARKRFTVSLDLFSEEDGVYVRDWMARRYKLPPLSSLDERIKPGEHFRVEMPDLEGTKNRKGGGFTVYVPTNFAYPDPVPMLVFLLGGSGGEDIKKGKLIAGTEDYLVVGLPYPKSMDNKGKPYGYEAAEMNKIGDYHTAMLKKVAEMFPNLVKARSVVAGSSNGAHVIGTALDLEWESYQEFFRGYMLHEGGQAPEKKYPGASGREKFIWVGWGSDSTAKGFSERSVLIPMKEANSRTESEEIPGTTHDIDETCLKAMNAWLVKTAPKLKDAMKKP